MAAGKERNSIERLETLQATCQRGRHPSRTIVPTDSSNRPLRVNLFIANVTVWLMFVVAGVVMAFALLAMDELRYDDDDLTCASNYIAEPEDLWRGNELAYKKFHSQCRLLYSWAYILTVAGSFSLVRTSLLAIPIRDPTYWTIKFSPGSLMGRVSTPSRVYLLRTTFSFIPGILYTISVAILASSGLIKGPAADDAYRIMYAICLGLVIFSMVVSLHQALSTGWASWVLGTKGTESVE